MHVTIPGSTFDATEHGNPIVVADMFGVRIPYVDGYAGCRSTSPVNAHGTYWTCTRVRHHGGRCHSTDAQGRVYAVWHRTDW